MNVNCAWARAVCQWSMYRPGYSALTRCDPQSCDHLSLYSQMQTDVKLETGGCSHHQGPDTHSHLPCWVAHSLMHTCPPHTLLYQELALFIRMVTFSQYRSHLLSSDITASWMCQMQSNYPELLGLCSSVRCGGAEPREGPAQVRIPQKIRNKDRQKHICLSQE